MDQFQGNINQEPVQKKPNHRVGWLIILLAIVIAGCGVWYYLNYVSPTSESSTSINSTSSSVNTAATTAGGNQNANTSVSSTTIKNDADLQTADRELDNVNVNSIDSSLSQNDTDSSEF